VVSECCGKGILENIQESIQDNYRIEKNEFGAISKHWKF
jgi:hypothetical protein